MDNNGAGPALSLEAGAGKPPLVVNASAGKATNLDADTLDGKDSEQFASLRGYEVVETSSSFNTNANKLVVATCPTGKKPVGGGGIVSNSEGAVGNNSSAEVAITGSRLFGTNSYYAQADYMGGPTASPTSWRVIAYAICATV